MDYILQYGKKISHWLTIVSKNKGRGYVYIDKTEKIHRMAILIDEYDKPLIDFLDNIQIAGKNRMGIAFSSEQRNIAGYRVKEM